MSSRHIMETIVARATDVIATAGATSSVWSPWLIETNASLLVPIATILGIVWLLVQIAHKIKHWNK